MLCEVSSRVGGCDIYKIYEKKFGINLYHQHALLQVYQHKEIKIEYDFDEKIYAGVMVPSPDGIVRYFEKNCPIKGVKNYSICVNEE